MMKNSLLQPYTSKLSTLKLILYGVLFSSFLFAEEPLPMAPKRYDLRDELPTQAFVSITGEDPKIPGENKTNVANKQLDSRHPANSKGNNSKPSASNKNQKAGLKTKANVKVNKKSGRLPSSNKKLPSKKSK